MPSNRPITMVLPMGNKAPKHGKSQSAWFMVFVFIVLTSIVTIKRQVDSDTVTMNSVIPPVMMDGDTDKMNFVAPTKSVSSTAETKPVTVTAAEKNAAGASTEKAGNTSSNKDDGNPVVLVTGCSSNHFNPLFYVFLPSVFERSSLYREGRLVVIFYDLGLSKEEIASLRQAFPQVIYRRFNYKKYPAHVNIQVKTGEYAWKPIIINQVATEFRQKFLLKQQLSTETARENNNGATMNQKQPGVLFWLDAGSLFPTTDNFNLLLDYVKEKSIWSPSSSGTVQKWCHPGMVSYMELDMKSVGDWIMNSGGLVGMDINDDRIVANILIPWQACALVNNCIGPLGSNLLNHRQDQSALTLLVHINRYEVTTNRFGVGVHQDNNWREAKRKQQLVRNINWLMAKMMKAQKGNMIWLTAMAMSVVMMTRIKNRRRGQ